MFVKSFCEAFANGTYTSERFYVFFYALVHKAGLNCLKFTTTYLPHSCRVNQFIYVEQKIVEKVYLKLHFLFESR